MKSHPIARKNFAATCFGFVATTLSTAALAAPPTWLPEGNMTHGAAILKVEDLKEIYLECDRQASITLLDAGTAAACSAAGEKLRLIGFDGRSEALLSWWKAVVVDQRNIASAKTNHTSGTQTASR